jgi:hypothetical protein
VTTIPKEQPPSEAKDFDEMEHAVATRASDRVSISRQAYDQSLLFYHLVTGAAEQFVNHAAFMKIIFSIRPRDLS